MVVSDFHGNSVAPFGVNELRNALKDSEALALQVITAASETLSLDLGMAGSSGVGGSQ